MPSEKERIQSHQTLAEVPLSQKPAATCFLMTLRCRRMYKMQKVNWRRVPHVCRDGEIVIYIVVKHLVVWLFWCHLHPCEYPSHILCKPSELTGLQIWTFGKTFFGLSLVPYPGRRDVSLHLTRERSGNTSTSHTCVRLYWLVTWVSLWRSQS